MALTDDLKDYIALNSTATTVIKEKHNVAIVGETHAFLKTTDSEIRTKATVRLLLELLADVNYKYFANESYQNKGKIRRGVEEYMRTKTLPPAFDPKQTNLDIEEIGKRVLVRRYLPVLDFIRANPRYILNIGSLIDDDGRDAALAQNFLDEFKDARPAPRRRGRPPAWRRSRLGDVGCQVADGARDPAERRPELRVDKGRDGLPEEATRPTMRCSSRTTNR